MAHPFYSPEEDLTFDTQPKRETLSFPRPVRNGSHQGGMGRRASCMSPAELDSKNRNPTRRRIQVACNRCRKRKIKCSGDTGDGQGCSNCRSSGNTDCHFLRVNSSVLQTKVSGWPYPLVNATVSPHRTSMYTSKNAGISVNQNVWPALFSRPAGCDGLFERNVDERPPFSVDQGINYEDDPAYQPAYMMASGIPDYSGMWNQKTWNPKQNGAMFPDQDENSLAQSAYPYIFPTGTPSTESLPVVPTMGIPSDGSQTDRTLPNPASRQVPSNVNAVPSIPDVIPTLPFTQDFRFGNPWAPRVPAPNPRTLMSMPFGPFTIPMPQTKQNSSAAAQDMGFGFLPINSTTATEITPTIPSSTAAASSMESVDVRDAEPQPTRSFPSDRGRLLSLGDCTSGIYGYSTSEKSKYRTSDSETDDSAPATLLNGLPYTRVRHPETSSPFTFSLLTTDPISEYRPPVEAQQTVSPLGNNGF